MRPVDNARNNTGPRAYSSDIDLFDLLELVWRSRRLILFCIIVGVSLAGLVNLIKNEEVAAHVQVGPPELVNLGLAIEQRLALDRLLGYTDELDEGSAPAMTRDSFTKELFNEFLEEVKSVPELIVTVNGDGGQQARSADIRLSSIETVNIRDRLMDFISAADERARDIVSKDIKSLIEAEVISLKMQQKELLEAERDWKLHQLGELRGALDVAKRAGISDPILANIAPQQPGENLSRYSFLLGERIIEAQIKSLLERPDVIPLEYARASRRIEKLENLLTLPGANGTFGYLSEPALLTHGSSRLSFVIALGGLFGAMVGCGIIFLRRAYGSRQLSSDNNLPGS